MWRNSTVIFKLLGLLSLPLLMVIKVQAQTPSCSGMVVENSCFSLVSDGSADANYSNNLNCQWLVVSEFGTQLFLYPQYFETEVDNDVLIIHDGPSESDPVLARLSGSKQSNLNTLHSGNDSLLFVFKTNGAVTGAGWEFRYECSSDPLPTCTDVAQVLTGCEGGFSDGSGTGSYGIDQDCRWNIETGSAGPLEINFSRFNLDYFGDEVRIYDGPTITDSLLATYVFADVPEPVTSSSGEVLVRFLTDDATINLGNNTGWDLTYQCVTTSVTDINLRGWHLFPNPSSDGHFLLEFGETAPTSISIEVFESSGIPVVREKYLVENNHPMQLDFSFLKAGIYMCRFTVSGNIVHHPLVITG